MFFDTPDNAAASTQVDPRATARNPGNTTDNGNLGRPLWTTPHPPQSTDVALTTWARRVLRPGVAPKMMYPLVQDLAVDGIPVTLTCRVLGFSKQAFYKWQTSPVTDRGLGRRV